MQAPHGLVDTVNQMSDYIPILYSLQIHHTPIRLGLKQKDRKLQLVAEMWKTSLRMRS